MTSAAGVVRSLAACKCNIIRAVSAHSLRTASAIPSASDGGAEMKISSNHSGPQSDSRLFPLRSKNSFNLFAFSVTASGTGTLSASQIFASHAIVPSVPYGRPTDRNGMPKSFSICLASESPNSSRTTTFKAARGASMMSSHELPAPGIERTDRPASAKSEEISAASSRPFICTVESPSTLTLISFVAPGFISFSMRSDAAAKPASKLPRSPPPSIAYTGHGKSARSAIPCIPSPTRLTLQFVSAKTRAGFAFWEMKSNPAKRSSSVP